MPVRRLIVNADDLGLAESVNRGILETMQRGIVRSASLMVNTPAAEDAARRLERARREHELDVGIGLHFNIVAGKPMTQPRSLMRGDAFAPLEALVWRSVRGRIAEDDVRTELEAQLTRARLLADNAGYAIVHIDSHRHAHCIAGIFDVVLDTARRHRIGHVRHPAERLGTTLGRPRAMIGAAVLHAFGLTRPALDDAGFAGLALMGSPDVERDFIRLVRQLDAPVAEVMVHPGYDSPELAAIDPYRAPRERELRALTSESLRAALRAMGTELTHFGATTRPASGSTPAAREAS